MRANSYWKLFYETYEQLNKWLLDQEKIRDCMRTDTNSYQKFKRIHHNFSESSSFLLQISEEKTSQKLKEDACHLNKRWSAFQDRFKGTSFEPVLKFYECEHSLSLIKDRLTKMLDLIKNRKINADSQQIRIYLDELNMSFCDLESISSNLSVVNKLASKINFDSKSKKLKTEFSSDLKSTEDILSHLRGLIPEQIKNCNKIYTQFMLIEKRLRSIEIWLNECENLLKLEPDSISFEQSSKQFEMLKKSFCEYNYFQNVLINKTDIYNVIVANFSDLNINFTQLDTRLMSLKSKFQVCLKLVKQEIRTT